jgi:hypothetical protein
MLGITLLAWVAALPPSPSPIPQDTGTVDAQVYENSAYGVSVPRPFADWVFEPGVGRRTTTVIFHPRGSPLREELWGALVLTAFPGRASLGQVADQRVQVAWRPQLGPSFALVSRDSLVVAGFPAIHVVMSGAINLVALDAEEYVIARARDLIVLQFRYPRGLPRDSVAAGYQRVLGGLRIDRTLAVAAPVPAPPRPATAFADSVATSRQLPEAPWQVRAYDALVRYDTAQLRVDFMVRAELVNDGLAPADSVIVWLWPLFVLDSARTAAARLAPSTAGSVSRLRLPGTVRPQADAAVTFFYHATADSGGGGLPPALVGLAPQAAYVATEWLPRVQPMVDSAGQVVETVRPRFVLRFDVPESWRAITPGRLTSDVTALGRRRLTWMTDDVVAAVPAFALGPYRAVLSRSAGLVVATWRMPSDTVPSSDSMAASVRAAWVFCSRAFGRLPIEEVNVVLSDLLGTRGFAGVVLVGRAAGASSRDALFREVARSWWGNSVAAAGPGAGWLAEGLPAWSAIAARGALDGDTVRQRLVRQAEAAWHATEPGADLPLALAGTGADRNGLFRSKGVAALEAARRAAGEVNFREAILSIALEHRNGWITLDDLLAALGLDAQAVLRPFLY